MSVFARLRAGCAALASRAEHVRIDAEALVRLADVLAAAPPAPPPADPARQAFAEPAAGIAYVVSMNAINFGSGWFPHLRKRAGRSGYLTLAVALRERFESKGFYSAAELRGLRAEDCAALFEQPMTAPIDELMALYARALRELGELLAERHAGDFGRLVAAAGGSAEALVLELARMPLYRDVIHVEGLELPFYKRGQITVSDLADACGERFRDLGELTLFADNLVPHVLRMHGVLRYTPELAARIDAGRLLPSGAREEIEIRALALEAVERLVAELRDRGLPAYAHELDHRLWESGQSPEMKAVPRHRTRCSFY